MFLGLNGQIVFIHIDRVHYFHANWKSAPLNLNTFYKICNGIVIFQLNSYKELCLCWLSVQCLDKNIAYIYIL